MPTEAHDISRIRFNKSKALALSLSANRESMVHMAATRHCAAMHASRNAARSTPLATAVATPGPAIEQAPRPGIRIMLGSVSIPTCTRCARAGAAYTLQPAARPLRLRMQVA